MTANDIKIVEVSNYNNNFYLAKNGKLNDKNLELHDVNLFNVNKEKYEYIEHLNLNINFNNKDIIYTHLKFLFIIYLKFLNPYFLLF